MTTTTGTRTVNLKLLAVVAAALLVAKLTSSRVPWWASLLIVAGIIVTFVLTCHRRDVTTIRDNTDSTSEL